MLREESIWIRNILKDNVLSSIRNALDVGSSTKKFRTQTQAYIDKNVFAPMRERNIEILYLDKKKSEDIDYACDIENINSKTINRRFDLVICCSLLEHVKNQEKVSLTLMELVSESGFLIVTVPQRYRYHPDPIDTMFRPLMSELISFFPGMTVVWQEVIIVKDRRKYRLYNISELLRYLVPALRWKVNCILMRKNKL